MRNLVRFTSVALALVAGPTLLAQASTGSATGTVKNKAGAPLAGVKIILSSKQLIGGAKVVVTDEKGAWKAFLLPPGDYDILASKDGFVSSSAKNVRVGLGAAVNQDLTLKPVEVQTAVVEVTAGAAGVDKTDTKAAANFSAKDLGTIPTVGGDRSFQGALSVSPGVVTETPSGRPTVRGGTLQDMNFRVNGADVKDDQRGENTGTWVVEDNIEDVQVVLSPLHARYGRALGGSVNVVTKSGGNDFAGSIRASFNRQSWNALDPYDTTNRTDDLNKNYQVTFSGPIVKDKLWFSVATIQNPESSAFRQTGWYASAGWARPVDRAFLTTHWPGGPDDNYSSWITNPANWNMIDRITSTIPGTANWFQNPGQPLQTGAFTPDRANGSLVPAGYVFQAGDRYTPYIMSQKSSYLDWKLTGAITPDHVLDLAVMNSSAKYIGTDAIPDGIAGGGVWHEAYNDSLGTYEQVNKSTSLGYRGTLSTNMLVDARWTEVKNTVKLPQGHSLVGGQAVIYASGGGPSIPGNNGSVNGMSNYNWRFGMPFGAWYSAGDVDKKNTSYNVNLKYLLDAHELDFGIDGFQTDYSLNADFNTRTMGAKNRVVTVGGIYSTPDRSKWLFPAIKFTGLGQNNQTMDYMWGGWPKPSSPYVYGLAPVMIQYQGPSGGSTKSSDMALYANDLWTLNNHWNLMLGLRFENQKLEDGFGKELTSFSNISPRLQVRYDVNGDSKKLFTLTLAEYTGNISQAFASAFVASPQSRSAYYGLTKYHNASGQQLDLPTPGLSGDMQDFGLGQKDYYGVRFITMADLLDASNFSATPFRTNDISITNVIDGTLKAPKLDELTLSFYRGFDSGSSVKFTYVGRSWKNQWAIGQDYTSGEVVTTTPAANGVPAQYGLKTHYFNSDALKRTYNGLEVEWTVKTGGVWTWGGNWTYSRLTGNDEAGVMLTGSVIRDNGITPLFANRAFLASKGVSEDYYAPNGRLYDDVTNRMRVYATATFPMGKGGEVSFSWMGRYATGAPWGITYDQNLGALGLTNVSQLGAGSENSQVSRYYYLQQRRPFEQNDMFTVDFKMAFRLPLGIWKMQAFGDLQINNFFNTIRAGQYSATSSVNANGNFATNSATFGQAVWNTGPAFIHARTVQASLGLRF